MTQDIFWQRAVNVRYDTMETPGEDLHYGSLFDMTNTLIIHQLLQI